MVISMSDNVSMPDFRLRSYLEVVRSGKFSAAADLLGLTQPAVSQHIAALEESYGQRLLERTGRRAAPTPAGELLYDLAQRIESVYLQIDREMQNLSQPVRSYNVGATLTVAEYLMPPLIGAFQHARERIKIRLAVQNTAATIESLKRNRLAFAIVEGPFDGEGLHFTTLRSDELVAVCAPSHPLASGASRRRLPAKRLLDEDLILRERGSGTREVFERHLASSGIDPGGLHPFMEIGSNNAIKSLVRSEVGISIISELAVSEELRTGVLVRIPVDGRRILRDIRAVWNDYSEPSFVEDFRGFCTRRIELLAREDRAETGEDRAGGRRT